MTFIEELKSLGMDTDEGLDRVMGDKDLYEMMLGMFADAVRDNPVAAEDFGGDPEPLIRRVHMLKGTSGNLSLTPIFHGYNTVLGLLRDGKPDQARAEFETMLPVQDKLIDCIRRYRNQ